ncbi:unnamed protein product [Polarella glacialis]|uniref:Uncharacterized protein n=1 Tax=Polarella glacialis TaxID=89957 RepID=A0A813HTN9_POLGL|nr:unnamed protein product [Polarella glacialis]
MPPPCHPLLGRLDCTRLWRSAKWRPWSAESRLGFSFPKPWELCSELGACCAAESTTSNSSSRSNNKGTHDNNPSTSHIQSKDNKNNNKDNSNSNNNSNDNNNSNNNDNGNNSNNHISASTDSRGGSSSSKSLCRSESASNVTEHAMLHICPPGVELCLQRPARGQRWTLLWQLDGASEYVLLKESQVSQLAASPWTLASSVRAKLRAGEALLLPSCYWVACRTLAPSLMLWRTCSIQDPPGSFEAPLDPTDEIPMPQRRSPERFRAEQFVAGGWAWFGDPENWLGAPAGHEPMDQVAEAKRREQSAAESHRGSPGLKRQTAAPASTTTTTTTNHNNNHNHNNNNKDNNKDNNNNKRQTAAPDCAARARAAATAASACQCRRRSCWAPKVRRRPLTEVD